MENRFLKRLSKKAKKGFRGWPVGTVAFYGPDLSRATKVVVAITHAKNEEIAELRDWHSDGADVRSDPQIAREILELLDSRGVTSVGMTASILDCPHQQGID